MGSWVKFFINRILGKFCLFFYFLITFAFFSQLLWIILVASCAALVIQTMAANLGVVTGTWFDNFIFTENFVCIRVVSLHFCSWFFQFYLLFAGKHLAEHCRTEYARVPNFILWVIAEIAIVACDIPEGIEMNSIFWIVSNYLYLLIV